MHKTALKLLLMGLFTGILYNPVQSLTRDDIISEVRQNCNDTRGTGKQRWTDVQIIAKTEIICRKIERESGCMHQRSYITTISSTTEYSLPSNFLAMEEVGIFISTGNIGKCYKKLVNKELPLLIADNDQWEKDSPGTPENYYIREASFTIFIGIHYPPNKTYTGGDYLRVDYIAKVSSMTTGSSEPFNGLAHLEPYHQLIVWGVTALCKWDEGKMAQGNGFYSLMDAGINRMKIECKDMPDYEGGFIAQETNGNRND